MILNSRWRSSRSRFLATLHFTSLLTWPGNGTRQRSSRFSFSFYDKPRSRLLVTGEPPQRNFSGGSGISFAVKVLFD